MLNDNPAGFSRGEFTVVEALHVLGVSAHVPAIEQYSLSLVSDNSTEHIKEGLFGILQREFSVCNHVEKAQVKMQVLPYAHSIFVTRSEEFRAELRSTARVACRHDDKMVHQPRLAHKRQSNAGMINTIQLSHFWAHPCMRLDLTDMPHGAQNLAQGWPSLSRHC